MCEVEDENHMQLELCGSTDWIKFLRGELKRIMIN